jgi:hypothetical protein
MLSVGVAPQNLVVPGGGYALGSGAVLRRVRRLPFRKRCHLRDKLGATALPCGSYEGFVQRGGQRGG